MIQLQFLSKILQDHNISAITVNNLTEEYFSDYKAEFRYILDHYNQYGVCPDLTTFLNAFPDFELLQVDEPYSFLLTELFKDNNKRFLAANFNTIRTYLMNDDVDSALQVLQQASEKSSQAISLSCVDILHDTSRYDAYIDRLDNKDKYFISTGFKELDSIIGGWNTQDDLVTIVARNGLGKTWLLLKFAAAAAQQGKRVGIYSGEMSENKVGYRIDSLLGHISNGALVHGGVAVKEEYKNFIENLSTKSTGNLFVLTPKMINGPAGVSALRAFIEKYNIEILFIDQHSLLEDDRKAKNPVEKAANISKDLKLLQVIKQIPVISVSQQNREKIEANGNAVFDTTQVAQADRIAQDSTCIIFIERDREKKDLMKLHLVKSRDTEAGKVLSYKVDLNEGIFTYLPEGEESTSDSANNSDMSVYSGYSTDDVF